MRSQPPTRVAVAAALCAALAACTGAGAGAGPVADQGGAATAGAEDGPEASEVRSARDALGRPMVELADALLAAAAAVDQARHAAARGQEAASAAAGVPSALDAMREATLAADAAARPLAGDGRIGRAADVVLGAAAAGLRAADQGAAEAAALQALSELDVRMDQAVAAWDAAGSVSQRLEALAAAAADLDEVAALAAAEPDMPTGCPALRDARRRWAELLAERTRALAAAAAAGTGTEFDEQRAAFAADPYGEDRLAADAADRSCWAEQSALARAAAGIRGDVETLEMLLQS